jgi:Flp pilus assembly pilin Flp
MIAMRPRLPAGFFRGRGGSSLSGYALIVGLVAVVALAAVNGLGQGIGDEFDNVADDIGATLPGQPGGGNGDGESPEGDNHAPEAGPALSLAALAGGANDFLCSELLDGADDADGDSLSVTALSGITGGTAVLTTDGAGRQVVRFTPGNGETAGGFDFTISDGQATATGHADITIQADNKLVASDAEANATFGTAVAMDGDTLLAGAPGDGGSIGAVYVYVRQGGLWSEQQKLTAADGTAGDAFGYSVSLEGDTALVGAFAKSVGAHQTGAAYVFTRSGATWSQQARLTASDAAMETYFGTSVSLSGGSALIGAYYEAGSGGAYVFTGGGASWTEQAIILPSDGEVNDHFGSAVALDGDTAVITSPADDDTADYSGSAYVYTRSGLVWTERAKLHASDPAASAAFGYSVAMDGGTILVGCYGAGGYEGAGYVFTGSGASWPLQARLSADDAVAGDLLGFSVALDGNRALIGALGKGTAAMGAGGVYAFTRSGSTWTQHPPIYAGDASENQGFGYAVAVSGSRGVTGAIGDGDGGELAGAGYVLALP